MYAHIYAYMHICICICVMRCGACWLAVAQCSVGCGVFGVACSLLGSEAKANKKKLHSQKKPKK